MPGQIVPYHQNGALAVPLLAPWGNQIASFFSSNRNNVFKATKDIYPRLKRAFTSKPKFKRHAMPSSRKYTKRSRKSMYKKRPRAVRRVQSIRKKARKRGNVRAAKKLVLPLGGFQERRIIRLKDVISFNAKYTGASLDGTEHLYNGVPFSTKLAQHLASPLTAPDPTLGKCQQFVFFMNDLRNFYGQGKFVAKGGDPMNRNSWAEPPLNHDATNQLRKIPLSRVHAKTFQAYTVIGSELVVKLTNNEVQRVGSGAALPSHKVWYAWRMVPVYTNPNQEAAPGLNELPNPVEPDTTFQALKETGKWRMGVVSASATDRYATRTFKIPFNSRRMFGADKGKPGDEDVTGLMTSPGVVGEDAASAKATVGSPRLTAYLQLILGPQNLSDVSNRHGVPGVDGDPAPAFGSVAPAYALTNCQVDMTANFYVSLTNPYPIQVVSADGIAYPVQGEAPATGTTNFINTVGAATL